MKTTKLALLLSALLATSQYASANCRQASTVTAPAISFDLSTELTSTSTPISKATRTTYPGNFTCTPRGVFPNTVGIASPFQNRTATVGFNGGKQFVSITVTALEKNNVSNITTGSHPASDLDANFTMQFTLVDSKPATNYIEVPGSTTTITPVIFASDASTLGLVEWLIDVVARLLAFLLGFVWTTQPDDIFLQPVQITYNPILTTCNFSNQGLVVSLPPVSINTVKNTPRAGYTPFNLNFACKDFLAGGNASRDISIFLSSNSLLAGDKTVLNNTANQGAAGVGFRLVTASNINTPLTLSNSTSAQSNATSIFSVNKGNPIAPSFSINMGAYYYPYNANSVTQGAVSSTATVVMSYN
ncbi:fimbrial protein [Providencia rustigianii]|uniref:fimbrial protein n=1 Tax=Providencia rustigianii TaxID=158850 RepID=UPI0038B3C0EC